ncbi:MAG TPA: hypothetical protein DC017_18695, partial [Candidatus Wallbacteria bacterium]|nr:hypothetical protein [Candidatus Wallbacteria bacterium]
MILPGGSAVPSAAQVKAGTDASNGVLAGNLKGNVALTANVEATANVTGLSDGTAYDIYVAAQDGALNLTSAIKVEAGTAMILTVDSTDNNVDNNIVMTFTDSATWRTSVTAVKIGATTLTAGAAADYELAAGTLTLHSATGIAALKTPGTWNITVLATGYPDSTVNQSVLNGVLASFTVITQPAPGVLNGSVFSSQPVVTLKDQYNNTITSGADSTANVLASVKTGDTWTLGGTTTKAASAGIATFDNLTYTGRQIGAKMTFAKASVTIDSSAFNLVFPVSDLAAVSRDTKVNLTFTAPAGATTVQLHKSSTSAVAGFADTGVALASASTGATVEGLTNGTMYWFKLAVTGGTYAGDSNVASSTPSSVIATVIASATAGGDAKINLTEKAAGFNVIAQSSESSGKIYLVPNGVYADEAALDTAKISSALVAAANSDTTIAVSAANAAITDTTTYQIYAVNASGTLSAGVNAFTADLTVPVFAGTYPKSANVSTTTLDLKVQADKICTAFYVLLPDGATAPSGAQVKAGTDASDVSLAANLKGNIALAANVEATANVTGLSDGTAYDIYVAAQDVALNLTLSAKADAGTSMILTADNTNNNVDNDIVIIFTDNATWRSAVTSVKIGATTLTAGAAADYELAAGTLTLHPATGIAALKTPGTWSITVLATGYSDSTINQNVTHGALSALAVTNQPLPGATNGGTFATQPVVTLKDQYNNTITSGADATANVVASKKAGDTWTFGGTTTKAAFAGIATFDNLTHTGRQIGAKITFVKDAVTIDSSAFNLIFPVSDLAAVSRDTKVNLTFTAPAGATTVQLHKSSTSAVAGFADTGVALTSASLSAIVEGLTNGTQYWFKLVVTGGT